MLHSRDPDSTHLPKDIPYSWTFIPWQTLWQSECLSFLPQDISNGHAVDTSVFYTVEDRPVVKERVSQYVDKQYIAKEFEKRVRSSSDKCLSELAFPDFSWLVLYYTCGMSYLPSHEACAS